MLLIIFSILVSFIFKFLDINALVNGSNAPNDKTYYNKALNNIHNTKDLCYIHFNYTGRVKQPAFAGWFSFVEMQTRIMKSSELQIDCPVKMVCSQSYGTAGYFVSDAFLNPAFMVEDCRALFKNLEYRQYKTGHDMLLSPFDNGTGISYKDILDYLLL
jgi:hypothetical protein